MAEELPVSLNERVISMLENVVNENRRLREMIETRDAEQERLLQRFSAKLDGDTSGNSAVSRKRKRKIAVPQQCRQDFRKMYKVMQKGEGFAGFVLSESVSSQQNEDATKAVIEAVVADQGGADKCPWSPAEMKSAAGTYFKSLSNALARTRKGKEEEHKTICRRQGRMRDKSLRRLSLLKTMPWSEEKKSNN
ncbi:uncharacterized protein [Montipora foliosa]|uniref:uncharacterized protein n=1 Tax=Montipora foliosa TaxID=591990 RepID=UPI0035F19168